MSLQFSTTLRNAIGDVVESTIGTAPTLEIRTGAAPANCGTADSGTVLATMTLPSDWMAAASGGSKALAGTWEDLTADATGTAAHFRIKAGATCHMQGTCGMGSGDLQLDNTSIATGQKVTITSFTLTAPGV
ncbi:MAG: hypothetical protein KBD62_36855 [Kofleriaceae bacterium]|nr:hypothetical protein [Kofleriaceae bacterium]